MGESLKGNGVTFSRGPKEKTALSDGFEQSTCRFMS